MRLTFAAVIVVAAALPAGAQDGPSLYSEHCTRCHDASLVSSRVPSRTILAQLAPERIVAALETGTMREQGRPLSDDERRAIAVFITGRPLGSMAPPPPPPRCADAGAPLALRASGPTWNGWGAGSANNRYQPAANARLTAAQVPTLRLKWAFGFAGDLMAAGQPAVVSGRVFIGSTSGRVFSMGLRTGCVYWTYDADTMVRSAITVGEASDRTLAYFGDVHATVYAVDASTGTLAWKRRVDEHPGARVTGAPTLHAGRLYVPVSSVEEVAGANPKYECCTFRGAVVALDAASGTVVWTAHTIADAPKPTRTNKIGTQLYGPSGAAVWSAPTIDQKAGVLYVGTGDSYSDPAASTSDAILAFDLETGKLKWSRQITENDAWNIGCVGADPANCPDAKGPDHDFGSSPMLVATAGGRRVLVAGQKSGVVHGLDPDDGGRVLWSTRVGRGSTLGGIQWGPATDGAVAYVALSDPLFKPDGGLDPAAGGGLAAVRVSDGKIVWKTPAPGCGERTARCSPAQSAAVTAMPGIVFSGSVDGHMRAYAAATGEIVWDVDTARDFETVNRVRAHGGSIDLAGPTVVDGMLLLTSGYGVMGGMTGNVLLAFTPTGK